MTNPAKRPRAFGALIRDGRILMIKHEHDGRVYWTLPGGGVEEGETFETAVVREVHEETGLVVTVRRLLWRSEDGEFNEAAFLLDEGERKEASVGSDPELLSHEQMIKEVRWFTLKEMADDVQVSRVISSLNLKL